MDVQQKCLVLIVDGSDAHRSRLRERIPVPLSPEPEREERFVDGGEVRIVAIGNGEIEISLASAAPHRTAADVLDRRVRESIDDQRNDMLRNYRRAGIPWPHLQRRRRIGNGADGWVA